MKSPTIINLFGGPGIGKSTTALSVVGKMKKMRLNVEFVDEYAKQLTWEKRHNELTNQIYISAKQYKKINKLEGNVDWIVTDSPLIMGSVYTPDSYFKNYFPLLKEIWDHYNNINYFLIREFDYVSIGRNQTSKESEEIDLKILNLLKVNQISFKEVKSSNADEQIISDIKSKL